MKNQNVSFFASLVCFSILSLSTYGERATATPDAPSKLTGQQLHDRIITMRYCDLYIDGDFIEELTFHRDGSFDLTEMGANGAYGGAYGNGYGAAYGPYSGNSAIEHGIWGLNRDGLHIFANSKSLPNQTLFFGTQSYYKHRCYASAGDVR